MRKQHNNNNNNNNNNTNTNTTTTTTTNNNINVDLIFNTSFEISECFTLLHCLSPEYLLNERAHSQLAFTCSKLTMELVLQ